MIRALAQNLSRKIVLEMCFREMLLGGKSKKK
jgi:hypothetical protein